MNTLDHETLFERAWNDPRHTRYELPPLDINRVLNERYHTSRPLLFTRTMLWEMEARKARRPGFYISYMVADGSADAWGDRREPDGADTFVRVSEQQLWRSPETYGLVIEQTRVDHDKQKVTFIGAAEYPDQKGNILRAGTGQPIFHVIHGASGEENRPLNEWRVVLLTERPDDALIEPFATIARNPWLPGYVEIYIRNDLGIALTRRDIR